jgi:outer membrane immunogenic protein
LNRIGWLIRSISKLPDREISMKKILLGAVALIAIGAAPALAADLPAAPVYTKAPPPEVVYNWTGFYIGGNAGYAGGSSSTSTAVPGAPLATAIASAAYSAIASPSVSPNGFTGGAQIGYNWQVNRAVWGIEADINAFDVRGTSNTAGRPSDGSDPLQSATSVSSDWLATFRGRVGFLAAPRALIYATGGLAVADVKYSQTNFIAGCGETGGGCSEVAGVSTTRAGWTAGAGIEYAITNNWSVKGEYLYVDLGSVSTTALVNVTGTPPFAHSANLKENIGRVGLNYRFGGPAVAQY